MLNKLKQVYKDQEGAAMLLVAICLFMMIAFGALVIDGGRLYLEKSKLQKALDAAVLGAAQALDDNEAGVKSFAKRMANQNGYLLSDENIVVNFDEAYVEASLTVNKPLTLGKIFGLQNSNVFASARAHFFGGNLNNHIIPVFQQKEPLDENGDIHYGFIPFNVSLNLDAQSPYPLISGPGNGESGNYGYLNTGGKGGGAPELANDIKNGIEASIGQEFWTHTGVKKGKTEDAFQYRIQQDVNQETCQHPKTAKLFECQRVVLIAIVQDIELKGKSRKVEILDLLPFWLSHYNNREKIIYGYYVPHLTGGPISEGCTACNEIRLVK